MSVLEIGIIVVITAVVFFAFYSFFSSKKKKSKDKKKDKESKKSKSKKTKAKEDSLGEKKVEPAIKTDKPKEEKVEEKEEVKVEQPKKDTAFKIIRKQSRVKINKKALSVNSRNPSVTKVFANGKQIEDDKVASNDIVKDAGDDISKIVEDIDREKDRVMSDIPSPKIEPYGFREPVFESISTEHEFKTVNPNGLPNRSPIIMDRTNFGKHLNISEDGNLSGVVGTGVAKIIEQAESQAKDIDKKTDDMLKNIRKDVLGGTPSFDDMFNFISGENKAFSNNQNVKLKKLKNIDSETLILADAILNSKRIKTKK